MPATKLTPARIHGPTPGPAAYPPPSGSIDGSRSLVAIAGTAERIRLAGSSDPAALTGSIDQGDVVAGGTAIAITVGRCAVLRIIG